MIDIASQRKQVYQYRRALFAGFIANDFPQRIGQT